MSLFYARDREYDDPDLIAEDRAARQRRARMTHWCRDCLGFTGPGSPCYEEPEDEPDNELSEDEE